MRRADLPQPDDLQYVTDLGLIESREGSLEVANPIYREVISRELAERIQIDLARREYTLGRRRMDILIQ